MKIMSNSYIFIILVIVSCLYGVTIQQYRHFDINDTRGLDDTRSYIQMSKGNYDVSNIHKYRFIVPEIAKNIEIVLNEIQFFFNIDKKDNNLFAFYIINYLIMLICSLLLYEILKTHNFSSITSLVGVLVFLTSRTASYYASLPYTDGLYILGICVIYFLMIKNKIKLLSILLPIIILTKETILPFIFLPFIYTKKISVLYIISVLFSLTVFFLSRYLVDFLIDDKLSLSVCLKEFKSCISNDVNNESLIEIIYRLATIENRADLGIISVLKGLGTFQGIFSLFHSFFMIFPLSIYGFLLSLKTNNNIPNVTLSFIFFVSFVLAILSGNTGRMMFAAFLPVIIYFCFLLETLLGKK